MSWVRDLISEKRIVVCCGAGGVGKTTAAAALALGAAQAERRVLVLTIDPSRRLAETLGIQRNTPEPVIIQPVDVEIPSPGMLSAWVLDPKLVSDRTVERLARSPDEARRLLMNPIYQRVTDMVAGMQEYTAMEALHGFIQQGRFDLVILDTPPSRNALNFLEAPQRLGEFLDGRILKLLLPRNPDAIIGTTRRIINAVLGTVFGEQFYADLQVFFASFAAIFSQLNGNSQRMRLRLQEDDTSFLLVTSPVREALDDAIYFQEKIHQLGLPLGGFLLNRSRVPMVERLFPGEFLLPPHPTPHHRSALGKLVGLARLEQNQVAQHKELVEELLSRTSHEVPLTAIPELAEGVETFVDLDTLASWMLDEQSSQTRPSTGAPEPADPPRQPMQGST